MMEVSKENKFGSAWWFLTKRWYGKTIEQPIKSWIISCFMGCDGSRVSYPFRVTNISEEYYVTLIGNDVVNGELLVKMVG